MRVKLTKPYMNTQREIDQEKLTMEKDYIVCYSHSTSSGKRKWYHVYDNKGYLTHLFDEEVEIVVDQLKQIVQCWLTIDDRYICKFYFTCVIITRLWNFDKCQCVVYMCARLGYWVDGVGYFSAFYKIVVDVIQPICDN